MKRRSRRKNSNKEIEILSNTLKRKFKIFKLFLYKLFINNVIYINNISLNDSINIEDKINTQLINISEL